MIPTSYLVTCDNGDQRRFDTKEAAENYCRWGHCCVTPHIVAYQVYEGWQTIEEHIVNG